MLVCFRTYIKAFLTDSVDMCFTPDDGFMSGRRRGLKGVVNEELLTRGIEQEQQKIEAKQRARVAERFGLDLLEEDADEEIMIAYAQLLSQEEQERKLQKATA